MKICWTSLSPIRKTILTCAVVETTIFFILLAILQSPLTAVVCSLGFLGPISLWLGPFLLKKFRGPVRMSNNLSMPPLI
jgi:hypothetical protein